MLAEAVWPKSRKRLRLFPYKFQLLHEIKANDKPKRFDWAVDMLANIDIDAEFLSNFVFSDEATFYVNGHVNRYNCRYWATENPHQVIENRRGLGKVNVWCALAHNKVVGTFYFHEPTVKGGNYLDMLEQYAVPLITNGDANLVPYSSKMAHLPTMQQ